MIFVLKNFDPMRVKFPECSLVSEIVPQSHTYLDLVCDRNNNHGNGINNSLFVLIVDQW